MKMHRLVDSETKGAKSRKYQCERAIGDAKYARKMREVQFWELVEHAKTRRATDIAAIGYFNQSIYSTNMQNFMNETVLFDIFQEVNGVEMEQREAALECGSKCADFGLEIERILRFIVGIGLTECSKIVESDHSRHSTDDNLADYFAEV